MSYKTIPVVDLFAGPGGLSEGFASVIDGQGNRVFNISVSIEKDPVAHQTLTLRALFRQFPHGKAPNSYYDYIRGDISLANFYGDRRITEELHHARSEAQCATLGETPSHTIDAWIRSAIGSQEPWVLIGGPPCQAYSVAGRSRMRGASPKAFENDKRHFLYKEYLRIIRRFQPTVFVMENVKGMLSSTHGGSPIFERILRDLSSPHKDLEYDVRSLVVDKPTEELEPKDFIIESERYGVPQTRHRVILLGVRRDHAHLAHHSLSPAEHMIPLDEALQGLPMIRSRLSREPDSFAKWRKALAQAPQTLKRWRSDARKEIELRMSTAAALSAAIPGVGAPFLLAPHGAITTVPGLLGPWFADPNLGGVCLHESRQHMRSDLHRYMFAACYAEIFGISPRIQQFPERLLPNHDNISAEHIPFKDRFRVQAGNSPSTTIVSHIAKDGHYYIHPDPAQCRSLTVREAARLQTFPDNYFFMGNKTQQYAQVGNAVPPYLAWQVGQIVAGIMTHNPVKRT